MSRLEQGDAPTQAKTPDQDVEKLESSKPAVQQRAISGFKVQDSPSHALHSGNCWVCCRDEANVALQWVFVVFSMLCGIFLFSLDNTVLADLVPIIVNQFHRVDQIAWLSVG